jgi:hypothetical protein
MIRALRYLLIAFVFAIGFPGSTLAQTLIPVPDHQAAYYGQNRQLIDRLTKAATDPADGKRLTAFEQLTAQFPLAAVETSRTLIRDSNPEVAKAAASFLAGTLAMADHAKSPSDTGGHAHHPPSAGEELARTALREAVDDSRPEIRTIAASLLATIGDSGGLNQIASSTESGRIKDEDAVSYYALGPAQTNSSYVARYLEKGSVSAQSRAVGYLAKESAHQKYIRDKIFLNVATPDQVRAAAATALSKSDPQFNSYALTVIADPKVPTEIYTAVMSGALTKTPASDEPQIRSLQLSIENFAKERPSVDLSGLKQQLQSKVPKL